MSDWLARNPGDLAVASLLGVQYIQMNRLDEARKTFERMLESAPDNVAALNNLAWVEARQGDPDQALKHARRAAELAPEDGAVKDTLGVVHLARGEVALALAVLREAAKALPDNAEIQFHLAQALARSGERDEARRILSRVLATQEGAFAQRQEAEALLRQLGE